MIFSQAVGVYARNVADERTLHQVRLERGNILISMTKAPDAPATRATDAEVENWVDCLIRMPPVEAIALLRRTRPDLYQPVIEAAIRRVRRLVFNPSLLPEERADALQFLIDCGVDPAPRQAH